MGDLETGEGTAGTRTFRGQGRGDMLGGINIFYVVVQYCVACCKR